MDFDSSLLKKIYFESNEIILILNKKGNVKAINPKGCDIIGLPENKIVGKNWFKNFIPPSQRNQLQKVFNQILSGSGDLLDDFENPILTDYGQERLVYWKNQILTDDAGENTGVLSFGRDMTENEIVKKLTDLENFIYTQKKPSKKFSGEYKNSPDILYIYTKKHGVVSYSSNLKFRFGFSKNDFEKNPNLWIQNTHPDYRDLVKKSLKKAINGKFFDIEYRIRDAGGSYHWVYDRITSIRKTKKDTIVEGLVTDITRQKETLMKLTESKKKFQTLFENSPYPTFLTSREGYLINCNRTFLKNYKTKGGHKKQEGRHISEFFPAYEEAKIFDSISQIFRTGKSPGPLTFDMKRDSGEIFISELTFTPLYDTKGNVTEILFISNDISKRIRAEEELKKSTRIVKDLIKTLPTGIFIYDFKPPGKLFLFQANPSAERLTGIKLKKYAGKEFNQIWPNAKKQGITKNFINAFKTGETYETEQLSYSDNRLSGAYRIRAFKLPDSRLAVAFEDITEIKKSEQKLVENEEKFRTTIEGISDGFFTLSGKKMLVTYFNNQAEKILGKKSKEVLNKPLFDAFPEAKGSLFEKNYRKAFRNQKKISFETYFEIPPYTNWYDVTVYPSKDGISVFFQLTTERKKANEEISFLANLLSSSKQPFAVGGSNGDLIKVNKSFCKLTGYTKKELLNDVSWNKTLTPKKWRKFENEVIQDIIRTKKPKRYEKEYLTKDKKIIPVEVFAQPHYDKKGKLEYLFGTIDDITDKKNSELEKQQMTYYLEQAQEIGSIGSWELDLIANNLVWTDENYRIFGVPVGKKLDYELFLSRIHPEDRKYVDHEWKKALKTKKYDIEHRLIVNGKTKWVREKAKIQYSKGVAVKAVGFTQDITKYKLVLGELKNSLDFNKAILDTSPEIIYVYDLAESRNVYSNDGIKKILGYTSKEIQSMGSGVIKKLMAPADFKKYGEETIPKYFKLKDGEFITHKYSMKHKKGGWRIFESKESIFKRNKDNTPKQIFGIITDITESEKNKKLLYEKEKQFQDLFNHMTLGVAVYEPVKNGENFIIKDINSAGQRLSNVSLNEVVGKKITEAFPGVKKMGLFDVMKKVHKTGGYITHPITLYDEKNKKRIGWFENKVFKIPSGEIITVYENLTEKKIAEEKLKENENNLKQAQMLSHLGSFKYSPDTSKVVGSDELFDIFEIDKKDNLFNRFFERTHPCDQVEVSKQINNAVSGGSYDIVHRLKFPDGREKWVHAIGKGLENSGKKHQVIGSVQDITSIKKQQDELKKTGILLKSSLESPQDMVIIALDKDYKYLYFNKGHEKDMKLVYGKNVKLGDSVFNFIGGKEDREKAKILYDRALNGESFTIIQEFGELKRNYYETYFNPILDGEKQIIGLTAFARDITERVNSQKELESTLKEKEILIKEVHHRVKNNLQLISSLLDMQTRALKDEKSKQGLLDSLSRVKSMSIIHQNLYSSESFSKVDLKNYLEKIAGEITSTYKPKNKKINVNVGLEGLYLEVQKALSIGMIINELLTNSYKYAFKGKKAGKITITGVKEKNKYILTYKDDGMGLPEQIPKKLPETLGMRLIELFAKQLGAEIEYKNRKGLTTRIIFDTKLLR